MLLAKNTRFIRSFPSATVTNNSMISSIAYLVDTGADVSILHEKIAKALDLQIQPDCQILSGVGNCVMKPLGRSSVVMCTPTMTLEIDFLIVPDGSIPGCDVDALIGLDVLKRPGIKIEFNANSVDIEYDHSDRQRISAIYAFEENDLNLSGLDEWVIKEIKTIIQNGISQTPAAVTTNKLRITLRDLQPVAYKPRHLSYGERLQVKQIIKEQISLCKPNSPCQKEKRRHKIMCRLS